jgi:hypothetical protein
MNNLLFRGKNQNHNETKELRLKDKHESNSEYNNPISSVETIEYNRKDIEMDAQNTSHDNDEIKGVLDQHYNRHEDIKEINGNKFNNINNHHSDEHNNDQEIEVRIRSNGGDDFEKQESKPYMEGSLIPRNIILSKDTEKFIDDSTDRDLLGINFNYYSINPVTELTDKRKRMVIKKSPDNATIGYSYVSCKWVTTVYKFEYDYTYLTNPTSVPKKLYYIIKSSDHLFTKEKPFVENSMGQLTSDLIEEFIYEINTNKNLLLQFERYRNENHFRRVIVTIFSVLMMILGPILFFALRDTSDDPGNGLIANGAIGLLLGLIGIGAILLIVGLYVIFPNGKKGEENFFLKEFNEYLFLMERWNKERFIPAGVHCTTVRNLNYFQFTPINYVVLIEPHQLPLSLKDKANKLKTPERCFELIEPQTNREYSYYSDPDVIVLNDILQGNIRK